MDGNSCTDFFNYCLRKNHEQGQRNSKQGLYESNKRDNGKTNPPTARCGHVTTAIRSQFTQTAPERLIGWSSTICSVSSADPKSYQQQSGSTRPGWKGELQNCCKIPLVSLVTPPFHPVRQRRQFAVPFIKQAPKIATKVPNLFVHLKASLSLTLVFSKKQLPF